MQPIFTYLLVNFLRLVSRLFYRCEVGWIGNPPVDRWGNLRLVCILNHTSLFEWLFAAAVPDRFVRQLAWHGVVPVAEKTSSRPLVGLFYGMIARHVVPITRKRDHTWKEVLSKIEGNAVVVMLPEGRMKRSTGLDVYGNPMTVRAGVVDVIQAIPDGRMLIAYSGGLHHVQHPGEVFPRLWKTIRLNFENLDLAQYREEILARAGEEGFREAVVRDFERRRDLHCPPEETAGDRALPPIAQSSRGETEGEA